MSGKGNGVMRGVATGAPLVSVIVPAHNRADLLPRAVRSVLCQTHKNLELLVVDDASTDDTPTVVAEFARADPRVRYYCNETNLGAAESRNVGLRHARGQFVAFLDDDDEWLPDKLELQLPLAQSYAVVGCSVSYDRIPSRPSVPKDSSVEFATKSAEEFFFDNTGFNPTTMMSKTDHVRGVGGFDKDLTGAQGVDLFVRLVTHFGEACYVKRRLAVHYTHRTHGKPQITTGPKHLGGVLREFRKNRHLRSPAAQRYRLCQIEFMKMRQAKDPFEMMVLSLRSLSCFDLRRAGAYLRLVRGAVLLRLPPFPWLLALYRRVKYR